MEKDIHRIAAAKLFGVPEDQVTPEQRARAKTINYWVIYNRPKNRDIDGVPKKWLSDLPDVCEFCQEPWDNDVFYDAAIWVTPMGDTERRIWGLCCHTCFTSNGGRLGSGNGQKYDLQTRVKLDG